MEYKKEALSRWPKGFLRNLPDASFYLPYFIVQSRLSVQHTPQILGNLSYLAVCEEVLLELLAADGSL